MDRTVIKIDLRVEPRAPLPVERGQRRVLGQAGALTALDLVHRVEQAAGRHELARQPAQERGA